MTTASQTEPLRPLGATAHAPFARSAEEGLETIFGFDSFRDGQREAVELIETGKDALIVMPTGSGKSLCFQLTGALREGVTLVISPLIALMKDQVDALQETGLPVCDINSSMSWDEQQRRIDGMKYGDYKLVYIAPERFRSSTFRRAISQVEVGLLAVDEAHCVSQWGHDFRPDYLKLKDIREQLGGPQTVALTATATSFVQGDIVEQLGVPNAEILVAGFERPNLFFEVFQARGKKDKLARIEALAEYYDDDGSIIVYCATRKQVRNVGKALNRAGISAGTYHGGMGDRDRSDTQDEWMAGKTQVLAATNAFGMGVDKPDVRAVIHYNMPGSVEAYYQEAGRAGRDGEPAHCLLLFNYADKGIHEWFAENSFPLMTEVMRVWQYVHGFGVGEHELAPGTISRAISTRDSKVHPMAVEAALRMLQAAGHLHVSGKTVEVIDDIGVADVEIDYDTLKERRLIAKEQVANLVNYATESGCKQARLLHYFDDDVDLYDTCDHCSDCCGPPDYAVKHADALSQTVRCSDDANTLTKKVLSGIARASGKRGATTVAGMLVGSSAKAVKKAGFQNLSTYGILSEIRKKDATYLIDLFARHGLVRRNEHGCVLLTQNGSEVMTGTQEMSESLAASLERSLVKKSSRTTSSNRSSRRRSGVGETYDETLKLHKQGMGVEEVAEARGLATGTIARHFVLLADRGERMDIDHLVDQSRLEELRPLAEDWSPGDKVGPLMRSLPGEWTYASLRAHLTWLMMERQKTV
jgi:ATP-dependent DNA helicase RecQ